MFRVLSDARSVVIVKSLQVLVSQCLQFMLLPICGGLGQGWANSALICNEYTASAR